jgi:predicted N-formylglutamate amidohydrolase
LSHPPKVILSLHSFTPALSTEPSAARPWHIGVLYNQQSASSKRAIALLKEATDWTVGDQEQYSGVLLNASMNRHAEPNNIPYIGIEMRQDCIAKAEGQALFAATLRKIALKVAEELASGAII